MAPGLSIAGIFPRNGPGPPAVGGCVASVGAVKAQVDVPGGHRPLRQNRVPESAITQPIPYFFNNAMATGSAHEACLASRENRKSMIVIM